MGQGKTLVAYPPPTAANDVTDVDTLASMSQKGADPPDNSVRQTQRNHLGYENVVVDMIKGFSEVDKDSAYRLTIVDSSMPIV